MDLTLPLSIANLNAELRARPRIVLGDGLIRAQRSGDTVTLSINVDALRPLIPKTSQLYRVTGAQSGAGFYTARLQVPQVEYMDSTASPSMSAAWKDLNTSDDTVLLNLPEAYSSGGTHQLKTDGTAYVEARSIPLANGSNGKSAMLLAIANSMASGLFPVNLTQSGGSNGSAGVTATYTYNATHAITGTSISGGPFGVTWARRAGPVTAATHGTGFYNSSGTFVLWEADEQINLKAC